MAKKKRKFTKEGWDRLKSHVKASLDVTFKERKRMPEPEKIEAPKKNPFDHPYCNPADYDMIYLRGKK